MAEREGGATSRKWYSWRPGPALYDVPTATKTQVRHARSLLARDEAIPFEDWDGHVGAVGLLRDHLATLGGHPPGKAELLNRVRRLCRRPAFDVDHAVYCSVERTYRFVWIDPATVTHSGELGERFRPYHDTPSGLAAMALRILNEQADSVGLLQLFDDPRRRVAGINAWSVPGPLGPVRPIHENGNHRTIALQALAVPLVAAEIRPWAPPYRYRVQSEEEWRVLWPFLQWLEEHGVVRLARRPVVEERIGREVKVSDAPAPWLLGPPGRVLKALDVYEALKEGLVRRIGALSTRNLRETWAERGSVVGPG